MGIRFISHGYHMMTKMAVEIAPQLVINHFTLANVYSAKIRMCVTWVAYWYHMTIRQISHGYHMMTKMTV